MHILLLATCALYKHMLGSACTECACLLVGFLSLPAGQLLTDASDTISDEALTGSLGWLLAWGEQQGRVVVGTMCRY